MSISSKIRSAQSMLNVLTASMNSVTASFDSVDRQPPTELQPRRSGVLGTMARQAIKVLTPIAQPRIRHMEATHAFYVQRGATPPTTNFQTAFPAVAADTRPTLSPIQQAATDAAEQACSESVKHGLEMIKEYLTNDSLLRENTERLTRNFTNNGHWQKAYDEAYEQLSAPAQPPSVARPAASSSDQPGRPGPGSSSSTVVPSAQQAAPPSSTIEGQAQQAADSHCDMLAQAKKAEMLDYGVDSTTADAIYAGALQSFRTDGTWQQAHDQELQRLVVESSAEELTTAAVVPTPTASAHNTPAPVAAAHTTNGHRGC
jgi:hypothetical protein